MIAALANSLVKPAAPIKPRRRHYLRPMPPLTVKPTRLAFFTTDSLAAYLQVSDRMIRKWVAEGRLRSYKLDGCRRFDPADVDTFVAQFQDEREVVVA